MKIAVISAVKNEEQCIPIFLDRVKKSLDKLSGKPDWQIIFMNDGSTDGSLDVICRAAHADPRIKVLTLSRSFGYQAALLGGLKEIEADYYTIVDVDCEDPPELISDFWSKIQQGFELVYGIRSNRTESRFLTLCRKIFYKINSLLADSHVYMWMAEFSMFSKLIRDAIISPQTTFPFLRTEMAYVGYRAIGIEYKRVGRVAGKSNYNIWRMVKFGVGGILAGTTFPLRAILYLSGIFALIFLILCLWLRNPLSIGVSAAILLFIYVLISFPLVGIYLARTYRNIVNRPNYFIDPHRSIY